MYETAPEMLLSSPFGVMLGLVLIFGVVMGVGKVVHKMDERRRIKRRLRMR